MYNENLIARSNCLSQDPSDAPTGSQNRTYRFQICVNIDLETLCYLCLSSLLAFPFSIPPYLYYFIPFKLIEVLSNQKLFLINFVYIDFLIEKHSKLFSCTTHIGNVSIKLVVFIIISLHYYYFVAIVFYYYCYIRVLCIWCMYVYTCAQVEARN